MNTTKSAELSTEKQQQKIHTTAEPFLLHFIEQNFKDWFTPRQVFDKLGQLNPDEIQAVCLKFSPIFFCSKGVGHPPNCKWSFKVNFRIIS